MILIKTRKGRKKQKRNLKEKEKSQLFDFKNKWLYNQK